MDRIFPFKNQLGKWNEKTVTEVILKSKNRKEFHTKYTGASSWCRVNKREDLLEKHFEEVFFWTKEKAIAEMEKYKRWSDIRKEKSGLRHWMYRHGGEPKWKRTFLKMKRVK